MNVVADSSVLIALSTLGELELLKELFGGVFIAKAVWREVVEEVMGQIGAEEVRTSLILVNSYSSHTIIIKNRKRGKKIPLIFSLYLHIPLISPRSRDRLVTARLHSR